MAADQHDVVDDGPTWVGELDRLDPPRELRVDPRFTAARLWVTAAGAPQGQITVPLTRGAVDAATLVRAYAQLGTHPGTQPGTQPGAAEGGGAPAPSPTATDPLTVVLPTRGRAASLVRAVRAVLDGDHPDVQVVVVDNAPADDATRDAVVALHEPRVTYLRESRPGASAARNRGLAAARTELVAFVDDDTRVDARWAARVAGAFAADRSLAAVSGPVLAASLAEPAERAADAALGWDRGVLARRFTLADPPADEPLFPFCPGLLGVGANLAVRASVLRDIGGFDEALGPGTPTRGGEDVELLIRLVLAGHAVGYVPGAWLWHHHRADPDALRDQLRGYAVGLGAVAAKVALAPGPRRVALRRTAGVPAGLRRIVDREVRAGTGVGMDTGVGTGVGMAAAGAPAAGAGADAAGAGAAAAGATGAAGPWARVATGTSRLVGMLAGARAYPASRRAVLATGGCVPPMLAAPVPAARRRRSPAVTPA